ncbi:MAG: adaptor protein MecA [Clostridia bacterium]|nr:adaptor protein MecA [Clostridia bacterium]
MIIKKINENRIKIQLKSSEITQWSNLYGNKIPDYNAMMLDLIGAAEKETGISFRNCQVVVEAGPCKNNVYEIFVTKNQGRTIAPEKRSVHRIKDKEFQPQGCKTFLSIVAEFDNIEDICSFGRIYPFYSKLLKGNNTLYEYQDMYYLDITLPPQFESYYKAISGKISEFSTNTKGTILPYMLSEHGKCIIKDNALLELQRI